MEFNEGAMNFSPPPDSIVWLSLPHAAKKVWA
jgi:hypothetical protein